MSKKISRRVFLKATGFAALAVAASGALTGCGNGTSLTPNVSNLPSIDDSTYADLGFKLDLGPLSGSWSSQAKYEADGKSHNYIYTALSVDNQGGQSSVTLTPDNFSCSISGSKVCSIGNFDLNSSKNGFDYQTSLTVPAGKPKMLPIFIDLGSTSVSSLYGKHFTITVTYGSQQSVFTYDGLLDDPTAKDL